MMHHSLQEPEKNHVKSTGIVQPSWASYSFKTMFFIANLFSLWPYVKFVNMAFAKPRVSVLIWAVANHRIFRPKPFVNMAAIGISRRRLDSEHWSSWTVPATSGQDIWWRTKLSSTVGVLGRNVAMISGWVLKDALNKGLFNKFWKAMEFTPTKMIWFGCRHLHTTLSFPETISLLNSCSIVSIKNQGCHG